MNHDRHTEVSAVLSWQKLLNCRARGLEWEHRYLFLINATNLMQNTWRRLQVTLCFKELSTLFTYIWLKFCVRRNITPDISVILKPTVAAVDVQQNRFDSMELKQNTCQLKASSVSASSPPVISSYEETALRHLTSFTVQRVQTPAHRLYTVKKRLRRYQRAATVASMCSPASSWVEARVPVRTYLWLLMNINAQLAENEADLPKTPETSFHFDR